MAKTTSTPATKPSKSVTKSLATKSALTKKSQPKTGAKTPAVKSSTASLAAKSGSKPKLTTKAAPATAGRNSPAKKSDSKSGSKSKLSSQKQDQKPEQTQDHQLLLTAAKNDHSSPSTEDRQAMIREAAYHIAEKDGFQPGLEDTYWHRAEEQIRRLLNEPDQGSEIH